MKIETLGYIYNLLVRAENESDADYRAARSLEEGYERGTVDNDTIEAQREVVERYMREHLKAIDALKDFESHDWH